MQWEGRMWLNCSQGGGGPNRPSRNVDNIPCRKQWKATYTSHYIFQTCDPSLLYIELIISFLIGWNFRNQCLWRRPTADYTIIMSRTLTVTGNHVMSNRGTRLSWLSSINYCLLSVPGPFAPPGSNRPRRKMTARSYSWTICFFV